MPEETEVVSKFWDLMPIFNTDAEGASESATSSNIFFYINKSFNDFEVPVSNIIGLGSDGCGRVMGANNYMRIRFKD